MGKGRRCDKIEPFKSKYTIERSAYRLDYERHIVHLRIISPDNGITNVEYFSYIIERGIQVFSVHIENKALEEMEKKMDLFISNLNPEKRKAMDEGAEKHKKFEERFGNMFENIHMKNWRRHNARKKRNR